MQSAFFKKNPILSKQQWNEVETIFCLHFIDEEMEAQKREADFPGGGVVGDREVGLSASSFSFISGKF